MKYVPPHGREIVDTSDMLDEHKALIKSLEWFYDFFLKSVPSDWGYAKYRSTSSSLNPLSFVR